MDINEIPVVGKINKAVHAIVLNLALLGVACLVLGIFIAIYPTVLIFLIAGLFILMGLIFLNIAYRIHCEKKKYEKFL